jgi:hypothetical protein
LLKAAIVYLQGSGGNLLSRTLSLSEKTVAYLPVEYSQQQPYLELSAPDRFAFYNNWDHTNWIKSESLSIWYKHGRQDFVNYENSDLWLIDQFHPAMFNAETTKKILWNNIHVWEHLIFIKYLDSSVELIKKLAKLKRPDMSHVLQIERTELNIFAKMQSTYKINVINWEHMLEKDSYINAVEHLSRKLDLNLNLTLVIKLWQSWKTATDKLLNE